MQIIESKNPLVEVFGQAILKQLGLAFSPVHVL